MTRRTVAGLLALALLGPPVAHAAAAAAPSRVEITLAIMKGDIRLGEGREVLEHDGKRYSVVSESMPKGIAALFINDVRRESRGAITAAGLKPERFEETGRRGGSRTAKFDWAAGKVTLAGGENALTVELPPGTLDQASFAFSFAFVTAVSREFEAHIADGGGVKRYRYRQAGRETLKTPIGEIETLHYEKVRGPDDKRGFEFWLAPGRHFLTVKLRYTEKNGDTFDSIVTRIETR